MASTLVFSTKVGQNALTAKLESTEDTAVQTTIIACARAMGCDTANTPPAEIARFWMSQLWRRTEAMARAQIEMERVEALRAEIDAELGALK